MRRALGIPQPPIRRSTCETGCNATKMRPRFTVAEADERVDCIVSFVREEEDGARLLFAITPREEGFANSWSKTAHKSKHPWQ